MLGSLRCKMRHTCQAMNWTRLRYAFLQWREVDEQKIRHCGLQDKLSGSWLSDLRFNIALGAWHIQQLSLRLLRLRRSCKQDKVEFARNLAEEVGEAQPQDVLVACRVQPKKKGSSGSRPLPCLKHADGQPCMSPQRTPQCWRELCSSSRAS